LTRRIKMPRIDKTTPLDTDNKGIMDVGLDKKTRDLIEKLVKALEDIAKIREGNLALAESVEELRKELKVTNEKLEEIRRQI